MDFSSIGLTSLCNLEDDINDILLTDDYAILGSKVCFIFDNVQLLSTVICWLLLSNLEKWEGVDFHEFSSESVNVVHSF